MKDDHRSLLDAEAPECAVKLVTVDQRRQLVWPGAVVERQLVDLDLPAASFAEKDGTYVNHAGLAQVIRRAARSPQEARAEGQVFGDLLERRGLYRAEAVRAEMAREVAFFAALGGTVSELGVRLAVSERVATG